MFSSSTSQRPTALPTALAALLVVGVCVFGRPGDVLAQTPAVTPARATVFIRVIGDVELVPAREQSGERRVKEENLELSTGSGVLISPAGHVLTAAHVVNAENVSVRLNGRPVDVRQTVRRIEVLVPGDDGAAAAGPLEATVLASDGVLDLAVLSVNGANLPFLDLGDSDALAIGDPVEAIGFPFGEDVEIGRPRLPPTVAPAPSVSRGNLSAFREDTQGERRFLQVTAALNVGNSGGPIVDADGYVVAVANSVMRSRGGTISSVGFGVSVNVVKRFLESYGVDAALRARRVSAGAPSSIEGKGLRLALLVGMTDTSPVRTRVEAATQAGDPIVLHVDRVFSAWPAARIAEALVLGHAFEPFTSSSSGDSQSIEAGRGRLLLGHAAGTLDDGVPVRMEYAILEAGTEKIVVRFLGAPHQVAFNTSVLRSALRQTEMDLLRTSPRGLAGTVAWDAVAPRGTALDRVHLPGRWIVESAGPFACRRVPAPAGVVGASPAGDFTIALRAGWLPVAPLTPAEAAAACGNPGEDASDYTREFSFLGIGYRVEGRFVAVEGQGLLQFESVAPVDQFPSLRPIFRSWIGK